MTLCSSLGCREWAFSTARGWAWRLGPVSRWPCCTTPSPHWGGHSFAQMALGYRYFTGINVENNCEQALYFYRKVAAKVADHVPLTGRSVGAVEIERIPQFMSRMSDGSI